MAEPQATRVLNVSIEAENDIPQQYVEVDANLYLGTQDGMRYTLVRTPDNKLNLVDTLSDERMTLNVSKRSLRTLPADENCSRYEDQFLAPSSGSRLIKLMPLKQGSSPCKGQGDELGNSILSPSHSISSYKESQSSMDENILSGQDSSPLTYATLVPKRDKKETMNAPYFLTPRACYDYSPSPTFPSPIGIRPARHTKSSRMQLISTVPGISPVTRGRRGATRQRRPRRATYSYTPQILHSTPTEPGRLHYSSDPRVLASSSSSRSFSSSSFEESQPSIEYPRVPNNTPTSPEVDCAGNQQIVPLQWISHGTSEVEDFISFDPRETHNEKERNRRLRIKNACDAMRSLLPCIADRLDNASVFEYATDFIAFVRATVGNEFDLEFLEQNCVY